MGRLRRYLNEDALAILENFRDFSIDLITGLAEAAVYVVREHHGIHRAKKSRKPNP